MKDPFSVRITFCEQEREFAEKFMEFLEDHVDGLNMGKPRLGGNPKYKEGGEKYDPEMGEFLLSYSRLNIKKGRPIMPRIEK